ncbi:MAG TPA: hypothetical protein VNE16_04170 [Vicinamibacterales bacterium]|nr:hypothetical protein [Vicinamibacterales bacterium]
MPGIDLETARRCPFDGQPLRRRLLEPGRAGEARATWTCLKQSCGYSEPEDPQVLFRFAWLSPVYRALSTRQEFRSLPTAERWTLRRPAAEQVTLDRRGTIDHQKLDGAEPAEILSWLETQRRRNQR